MIDTSFILATNIKKLMMVPMKYQQVFLYVGFIVTALGVGAYATSRPNHPTREWGLKTAYSGAVLIITIYGYSTLVELIYYIYGW